MILETKQDDLLMSNYENQIGALAAKIVMFRDHLDTVVAKDIEELKVTVSNHLSSTFNVVNEARDIVRGLEDRILHLELLVSTLVIKRDGTYRSVGPGDNAPSGVQVPGNEPSSSEPQS